MHGRSGAARALRAIVGGAAAGLALATWRRARRGGGPGGVGRAGGPAAQPLAGRALDEREVPEADLIHRVRERAAVPDGVEVAMTEGAVVLFGRIARHALDPLLQRVARVDGVSAVENRLTPVDEAPVQPPP